MGNGSSGNKVEQQRNTKAPPPAEVDVKKNKGTKEAEEQLKVSGKSNAAIEIPASKEIEEQKAAEKDATMEIAATLDDVTTEFLTYALKSSGHIKDETKVVSFEKIKFGREKGYLGDKCLLKNIVYEPGSKPDESGGLESIFVKLFPTDLVVPAAVVERFWGVEVEFLTKTVKALPDAERFKVPEIYFTEKGAKTGEKENEQPRWIILMEPIDDTDTFDILTSMPVEHALRAAKDLAILHAPYWGWSLEKFRSEKMFDKYGHMQEQTDMSRGMFTMGTTVGLKLFASADSPLSVAQKEQFPGYVEFWKFYEKEIWPYLQKRWQAVFKRWTSIPATLTHCDLHVENMICMKGGSNVYLDFQSMKLEAGVRDLAWLLASSLNPKDRRQHENTIVEAYHNALVSRGVEGYSLEQCRQDFVFMKIAGVWASVLGAGMFAHKNFSEKSGMFASEPTEDAIVERKRNNLLFSQVVDDLRHSKWPEMLKSLDEDVHKTAL